MLFLKRRTFNRFVPFPQRPSIQILAGASFSVENCTGARPNPTISDSSARFIAGLRNPSRIHG